MQFGSLIRIARLTPAAKGRTLNNVMADALLRILKVSDSYYVYLKEKREVQSVKYVGTVSMIQLHKYLPIDLNWHLYLKDAKGMSY